jgi:hypothetical protein
MRRFFLAVAGGIFLSACSNHPLIQDTTRYSTSDVVYKVRCEAHDELAYYVEVVGLEPQRRRYEGLLQSIKADQETIKKIEGSADFQAVRQLKQDLDAYGKDAKALEKSKGDLLHSIKVTLKLVEGLTRRVEAADDDPEKLKSLQAEVNALQAAVGRLAKQGQDYVTKSRELVAEKAVLDEKQGSLPTLQQNLLADYIATAKRLEKNKKEKDKPGSPLAKYIAFATSNLAMQFRFEITEDDNGTADGSIVWPVALGTITLGYNAGKEKKRFSERTVAVSEDFSDLLRIDDCAEDGPAPEWSRARIYPIRGNIGMGELLDQFLRINNSVRLVKREKESKDKKIFTDKLQFTTTLKGGVRPSLVLSPSTGHTVRFNGDFNADRKDLHEVIVDIQPGSEPVDAPADSKEPKETAKMSIEKMPDLSIRLISGDGKDGPAVGRIAGPNGE